MPGGADRAGHALKKCHQQFLIAMSGSFDVVVDDGKDKQRFHFNRSYYRTAHAAHDLAGDRQLLLRVGLLALASEPVLREGLLSRYCEYLLRPGRRAAEMKVPFLDFVGPYEELKAELDEAYFRFMRFWPGTSWDGKWRRSKRSSRSIAACGIAWAWATVWKRFT